MSIQATRRPPVEGPPASAFDKPLPENLDVERLVLGACFGNKDNLELVAEGLTREDFKDSNNRLVFDAMMNLRAINVTLVDRRTLADTLMSRGQLESVGGLSYLVSLDDGLPDLYDLKNYIAIVKEKARLRALISICYDTANQAFNCEDSQKLVQKLEDKLYVSFTPIARTGITRMSEWIEQQVKAEGAEKLLNPKLKQGYTLTTGIKPLDELTDGFHETEVWTIGAGAGVGKSALATQIMMHVAGELRKPVMMFSLEMSKEAIFRRMICQIAKVPVIRFKAGEVSLEERRRLMEATDVVNDLPIYIDDSASLSGSQLAIKTRRAKEHWGIALTIVDYLQLVRSSDPRHRPYDRMSEVSDTIRHVAKETTPFLQLSQLTRDFHKDKREPGMHDLKESGSIENNSHVIILPWREDMTPGSTAERGKAKLIVAKNRDGSPGKIPMRYLGWLMRFVPESEVSEEEPVRQPYLD